MTRLLTLCIAALVLPACSPTPPSQAEVEKFVRQYIAETDVAKSMALVSQEENVSAIAYGQIYQGWRTIRSVAEKSATGITLKVGTMDVTPIGPDTALAIAPIQLPPFQVGNKINPGSGAMTIVVKRTADGLRVIHEHYSIQPI